MNKNEFNQAKDSEFEVKEEKREINEVLDVAKEIVEDLADEFQEALENLQPNECPCCLLKDYLLQAYMLGRDIGISDFSSDMADMFNDIADKILE